MMRPGDGVEVYLYRGIVDMRKSIDGLSAIVEQELGLSPFGEGLFVFCNRKRDKKRTRGDSCSDSGSCVLSACRSHVPAPGTAPRASPA